MSNTRHRSQGTPSQGSNTVEAGPSSTPAQQAEAPPVGTLRLRAGPLRERRVVWSEGTVDNEGMGKKKSKICCIYHKPRAFDESSSDESNSEAESDCSGPSRTGDHGHSHRLRDAGAGVDEGETSESDGGGGDGRARPPKKGRRHHHHHPRKCDHSDKGQQPNKYDVAPSGPGSEEKGKAVPP